MCSPLARPWAQRTPRHSGWTGSGCPLPGSPPRARFLMQRVSGADFRAPPVVRGRRGACPPTAVTRWVRRRQRRPWRALRPARGCCRPGAGLSRRPLAQQPVGAQAPRPRAVAGSEAGSRELTCRPAQARLFDEPQLASLCLENIDKNTADAIAAEGFTDIDRGEAGAVGAPLPLPLPQPRASACAASPATGFCLAHLTLPPSVTGRATGAARSWRNLHPQRGQRPCVLRAAPWLGPRRPR